MSEMTIGEVIEQVETLNREHVYDRFCGKYLPVVMELSTDDGVYKGTFDSAGSWRGVYNEPCIFLDTRAETLTSSKVLLKDLYFLASGNPFTGYKGGRYIYHSCHELNMEYCYSGWTGDGYVSSVEYDEEQEAIVIKCTKTMEDY